MKKVIVFVVEMAMLVFVFALVNDIVSELQTALYLGDIVQVETYSKKAILLAIVPALCTVYFIWKFVFWVKKRANRRP